MNRTQVLLALFSVLVLAAAGLYAKGYWKTWEDYRPLITEAVGPCYADVVVQTATQLGCQPWNEPEQQFKKCMTEADGLTKMTTFVALMTCQSQPQEDQLHEDNHSL